MFPRDKAIRLAAVYARRGEPIPLDLLVKLEMRGFIIDELPEDWWKDYFIKE
jgi:hypothetical protein